MPVESGRRIAFKNRGVVTGLAFCRLSTFRQYRLLKSFDCFWRLPADNQRIIMRQVNHVVGGRYRVQQGIASDDRVDELS